MWCDCNVTLTNQRPRSRSRDPSVPIRGQDSGWWNCTKNSLVAMCCAAGGNILKILSSHTDIEVSQNTPPCSLGTRTSVSCRATGTDIIIPGTVITKPGVFCSARDKDVMIPDIVIADIVIPDIVIADIVIPEFSQNIPPCCVGTRPGVSYGAGDTEAVSLNITQPGLCQLGPDPSESWQPNVLCRLRLEHQSYKIRQDKIGWDLTKQAASEHCSKKMS